MARRCEETVKCLLMSLLQTRPGRQKSSEAAASRKKRHVNQARPTQNRQVQLSPRRAWKRQAEPGRKVGQDRAGQGKVAWRSWQTCMKTVR